MSPDRTFETTLRLQSVDDLFDNPALSPLSPEYGVHSGGPALEFLADEIYANSSYHHMAVTLEVPAPALVGHDEASVKAGVERWAAAKQRAMDHDVAATDWRGVRTLVLGFIAFAVLMSVSRIIARFEGDFADTTYRAVEVGAWVVLWFPLDLLVFGRWQYRLDRRAYRLVREMSVTLRPIPSPDST